MVERIAGMAGRKGRVSKLLVLIPCLLLLSGMLLWALGGTGRAAAATTSDIQEEFTQEINSVGDIHCTDVLKYDKSWFSDNGSVFEDYPSLLSRKYTQDKDVAEFTNFDVKVDSKRATVTITFDMPGGVYNEGDNWILYGGFLDQPSDESAAEMTFDTDVTLNDPVTLWEDMDVASTTTVKAPAGATDLKYDSNKDAITYVLYWKAASTGMWGWIKNNRPILIAVFTLVLLLGAGMLTLHVMSRKRIPVLVKQPKMPKGQLPPLPPPPPGVPKL